MASNKEASRRYYARNREKVLAQVRAYREANIERIREYDRERAKTPKVRQRINDVVARWKAANPEKRRAHTTLSNAIRDGKIVRQPCEVCGSERSHGHHDDYSKPLEVRWLCAVHHAEQHRRIA